ncbi:hypothetical protein [Petrocella sp. FN5]|uniref:hypothetical protein n=1 Tax=Petrocella sp. FN5 TaxID=3032002 RepID=UPI0023DCE54C|nr:hypothetical protein [Petrocella sp. FN5]MDF1617270.1 hypothetical protein [Petrocella sp. FN5]
MIKSINKSIHEIKFSELEDRLCEELEVRNELRCIAHACGLDASLGFKPIWACAINFSL